VKLRPKTSSSGGNNVFGVVVLVMLSFDGSMSLILVPTDASAWMLYARWFRHRNDAVRPALIEREEQLDNEDRSRDDRC
jgi:hypothetical protein